MQANSLIISTTIDNSCPDNQLSLFHSLSLTDLKLRGLFLFLSSYVGSGVDGFISNISLGSSFGWYFRLDQFELIFLCLLMLQLFMLRYLEILPLNMNNLFVGDPSGKKKRRRRDIMKKVCAGDEVGEAVFKLLRKLDDGDCFPFTLCQLSASQKLRNISNNDDDDCSHIPTETRKLIEALHMTGSYRRRHITDDCQTDTALTTFEDAVALGRKEDSPSNGTLCESRYPNCPLTAKEVLSHVQILDDADIFI